MNLRLAWLIMAIGLFACTTNAQNVVANNPVSTSAAEHVINNYQVVLTDQFLHRRQPGFNTINAITVISRSVH